MLTDEELKYWEEYGMAETVSMAREIIAARNTVIEQQAEIERLRGIVQRDAKRRMRDLTEWLNEDDANPILLRMAADDADLKTLHAILEDTQ